MFGSAMRVCVWSGTRWFHFRVSGTTRSRTLRLHILNAGASSFPDAWSGYQTCASYNLKDWFRVSTTYDKGTGVLTIEHTVKNGMVTACPSLPPLFPALTLLQTCIHVHRLCNLCLQSGHCFCHFGLTTNGSSIV